jgi:hypothetical protein
LFGVSQGQKISKEMGISFLGNIRWDDPNLIELVDCGKVEDYGTCEFMTITDKILDQLNETK